MKPPLCRSEGQARLQAIAIASQEVDGKALLLKTPTLWTQDTGGELGLTWKPLPEDQLSQLQKGEKLVAPPPPQL